MSEQVERTTSLYLRADDTPDGALARLADVVRHVTKARAIPLRDAAVQVAQVLGRRWGVEFALTRDDLLKRDRDFAAIASSADQSDGDSWDSFFYGDGYCHWMADQMSQSQLFQASEVGYGVVLPKEYKQLEPPKRCGDGALHFHRTHLDGVMPLPPVAWLHEVWGTLIEKDSELDQGPASAWCIRASLAAELFGYGHPQMEAGTGPDEGERTGVDLEVRIVQDYWTEKQRGTKNAREVVGKRYGITGKWVTSLAKRHADVPGGKAVAPATLEQAWRAKPRKSA